MTCQSLVCGAGVSSLLLWEAVGTSERSEMLGFCYSLPQYFTQSLVMCPVFVTFSFFGFEILKVNGEMPQTMEI